MKDLTASFNDIAEYLQKLKHDENRFPVFFKADDWKSHARRRKII